MKVVKTGSFIFFGLLFFMLAAAMIVLFSVNRMIDQTVGPINSANKELRTQVSAILNPTPTIIPDPITIIHEIQAMARLETIQYSVEKVITAEVGGGQFEFLFGDRLLFVAHGVVIGGVDLAKMSDKDFWIDTGTLYVRLPPAEIFVATLDNDKSYVFDRQTGLLSGENVNLETEARKAAEGEINKAAVEDGIVDLARANAETYLRTLFLRLGYPSVIFVE